MPGDALCRNTLSDLAAVSAGPASPDRCFPVACCGVALRDALTTNRKEDTAIDPDGWTTLSYMAANTRATKGLLV